MNQTANSKIQSRLSEDKKTHFRETYSDFLYRRLKILEENRERIDRPVFLGECSYVGPARFSPNQEFPFLKEEELMVYTETIQLGKKKTKSRRVYILPKVKPKLSSILLFVAAIFFIGGAAIMKQGNMIEDPQFLFGLFMGVLLGACGYIPFKMRISNFVKMSIPLEYIATQGGIYE